MKEECYETKKDGFDNIAFSGNLRRDLLKCGHNWPDEHCEVYWDASCFQCSQLLGQEDE